MNKRTFFGIPTRRKPKPAKFVIGAYDPNKKQTIPRGYSGSGYAAGVSDNGNVVGFAVDAGAGAVGMGESIESEKNDSMYSYGCIMLRINDAISEWLSEWSKKNIPSDALYINDDSAIDGYVDDHHVSMLYGIHDTEQNTIDSCVEKMPKINKLDFGSVEKFTENPEFDVITVSINTDLNDVHNYLCDSVEHTKLHDTFTPHITLAYVKKGMCDELTKNDYFSTISDTPSQLFFCNKHGEQFEYNIGDN